MALTVAAALAAALLAALGSRIITTASTPTTMLRATTSPSYEEEPEEKKSLQKSLHKSFHKELLQRNFRSFLVLRWTRLVQPMHPACVWRYGGRESGTIFIYDGCPGQNLFGRREKSNSQQWPQHVLPIRNTSCLIWN